MAPIVQHSIPYDYTRPLALPGIRPLDPNAWLIVDEAYTSQMRLRRALIDQKRSEVIVCDASATLAAVELLEHVLAFLSKCDHFQVSGNAVICPDGVAVEIVKSDPLATLGRIVQNDFCILQKRGSEHILTGAVLCFPASWVLAEKFLQPLIGIHHTVAPYDDGVAKRVQRLFDGVRVGQPLWRFNALPYVDPELHQPRGVHSVRDPGDVTHAPYLRSERQTLIRLPKTQAVVFGIHTFVIKA